MLLPIRAVAAVAAMTAAVMAAAPVPALAGVVLNGQPPMTLLDVMKRFQQMDTEISSMTDAVGQLQMGIAEVENSAKVVTEGVSEAEANILKAAVGAKQNSITSARLRASAKQTLTATVEATRQIDNMRKVLNALEGTASEMSQGTSGVDNKIAELKRKVRMLLPGVNDVTQRLEHVERDARVYSAETNATLDERIVDSITRHFDRETKRVQGYADAARGASVS
eukprot:TRINITY_DN2212_c0_g1_i1.p1 TRINITY_DN2212_c0_g1~~TRINITY_DN2212_c0_g1_i1.p1  ORF type:complete len:224 (+),score=58.92 TRINITY_DN2212_c0_g1_i1:137-808(+)